MRNGSALTFRCTKPLSVSRYGYFFELFLGRMLDRLKFAEVVCQVLRRGLPDFPDAERVEKVCQGVHGENMEEAVQFQFPYTDRS